MPNKKKDLASFKDLLLNSPIGNRLRAARHLHGWSVHELELRSGVSRATINNAEKSKAINSENLILIAETLQISLDDLISGTKVVN